ncbi:hypothetical protein PAE9249_00499 [Paenibacillus sp. CECT 9249]|uniref:hypothetical protein n=1 Tax=Paenibacillus sp. CECT 9249 TaxID=2845385 RepID=UPI001E4415CF|nr:hypothetical protein [Paenibacillus sp. CECT 9249]CAH0118034.1 hypothetical protein PAE9249_00499 [Paenibacillus sp. CECT 9249]
MKGIKGIKGILFAALSALLIGQMAPMAAHAEETKTGSAANGTSQKIANREAGGKTADAAKANLSLPAVTLSANISAKLADIQLLRQDEGNVAAYMLTYINNGAKELQLHDYWSRVKTTSGAVLPSKLVGADQVKKRLAPQSQTDITYYVNLGKEVNLGDLRIEVVKWDFSKNGYEQVIGSFAIPKSYNAATPYPNARTVKYNDLPLKLRVEHFYTYRLDDYDMAAVAVEIENSGAKAADNPPFMFVVAAANGANYPLQPDAASEEYTLQPLDKKTLRMMAKIPASAMKERLQLQVIRKDGGEQAVGKPYAVATFSLPEPSLDAYAADNYAAKEIAVGSNKVTAKLTSARLHRGAEDDVLSLQLNLRNAGAQTVKLPNYEFTVRGESGISFPITTAALNEVALKPLEEKNLTLSATIPGAAQVRHMTLSISEPMLPTQQRGELSYPIAVFRVPDVQPMTDSLGAKYTIAGKQGNYTMRLMSVQRLPWVDSDLVAARIAVNNEGLKAVELPKMQGLFKLDGAEAEGSNLVPSNANYVLAPKSAVDLYLVAHVPHNLDYSQLQIGLLEQIGGTPNPLVDFIHTGSMSEIPVVGNGETYTIATAGRQAEIKARKSVLYPGAGSNIIATDLEMKNLETRQAHLSQLVGYYMSEDGLYYQANVTQADYATSPQGVKLVTLWTKVPKHVTTGNMKLIVGEGVAEGRMSLAKELPTGYVNAAALELAQDTNPYKSGFAGLEIYPYKFSITQLKGELLGSSAKINFTYQLDRDLQYEMGDYEHRLVIELIDSGGHSSEKEIEFEKEMALGSNKSMSVVFDGARFDEKSSGNYQVVLHDRFQGQKRKIAHNGVYFYERID